MTNKIIHLSEIVPLLQKHRSLGKKIVQCHGVFDLLHPGHIRHFLEAKKQGDLLVVTVTPDRFVNKGPGRPAFNENLRTETLASLSMVDFVVLNDSPDAVSIIKTVSPHVYVKGKEYENHDSDITGKISAEANAVKDAGGFIYYTDDIVFSSSALLNRFFDPFPDGVQEFLHYLKGKWSLDDILSKIEELLNLKVLVIGDAIIDQYQYVNLLGQSGKGQHMTAECLDGETFLGGSLIVANHVAQFSSNVTLLTAIGQDCPHLPFIKETLDPKVQTEFFPSLLPQTLTKKRYVIKDGKSLTKLFETYSSNRSLLSSSETSSIVKYLQTNAHHYDLILTADFGNGFTNPEIISALSQTKTFLAVNTQTNGGNRGFNVISSYPRADYISLNEPELRLASHDKTTPLEKLIPDLAQKIHCPRISVTRGVNGMLSFIAPNHFLKLPAFITNAIDRIGAGDSFLALSSLCFAKGFPAEISVFLGSLAAALDVQIVGNREPVKKVPLCKYLTRLMK